MTSSIIRSTASGSTADFSVPFAYLDKTHVQVRLNGVLKALGTDYTFTTDSLIHFTAGNPASGVVVERKRVTPTEPLTDFSPGNLDTGDLNVGILQPLYLAQEGNDAAADILLRAWFTASFGNGGTITVGPDGTILIWDASGNVVVGPSATDIEGYNEAAQAAQAAAEAARDVALSAASAAQTARDNAYLWAQQDEDVAVNDGVHPAGNSAFHWMRKALGYATSAAAVLAAITLPSSPVADSFLQRNSANTAYDAKSSTEVRNALAAAAFVPDRAAVKALPVGDKAATTYSDGGRNGTWLRYVTSSLSAAEQALASADTLEGVYLTSGSYTWKRHFDWLTHGASARWWGLTADYNTTTKVGTSIHTAVNAGLVVVPWVILPAGNMLLSDKITMAASVGNPKKLTAAGRRVSTVYVNNGFNMAATGMIQFTGADVFTDYETTLHTLGGFAVKAQDQPFSAVLADYIAYPPVVNAQNQLRFNISNMLMQEVYVGIDAAGTTQGGGDIIDDIELSAFYRGIKIDACYDSVKISRLHWWPFGFPSDTATKRAVFATARGIETFRCDDFHLTNSLLFGSTQALYMGNGAYGSTFGTATDVDFDDRGGLVMTAGALSASSCFFTLGKTDSQLVNQSGGVLSITGSQFGVAAQSAIGKAIQVTGGEFQLTGSRINCGNFDDVILSVTNASEATIVGNKFIRTSAGAYANSVILASGSGLRATIVGNQANTLSSGTSEFVRIGGAMAGGIIANNDTPYSGGVGWTYTGNQLLANVVFANNTGRFGNRSEIKSVLAADRAGADVATAQNIFNSTEDALTLDDTTTYEFEAQYVISRAAGTTSHTFATLFGGTATFASIDYVAEFSNPTGNVAATAQLLHVLAATATVLTAANTSATEYIVVKLRGEMRIATGGTVIPQFQYSAAPGGAPSIKRNSFFKARPVGPASMVANGAWS